MNKINLFALLISLFVISCNQKTTATSDSRDSDECKWNDSKEYALCTSEVSYGKGNNPPVISYRIIDTNNSVIKEGTIDNGKVVWFNNEAIEIVQIPGNISEEMDKDDFSNIYVISTKETLTKKAYLDKD